MSANNIVQLSTTTPPPAPPWPMPPGMMPGCAPPGNSLMDCYWSVQQATAFISAIMIDAINNNPAVTQAIIDAITASGSSLPLIGVTDGSAAQPGQVGEFHQFQLTQAYGTGTNTYLLSAGVLQPGDWDVWAWAIAQQVEGITFMLSPVPAGFSSNMSGELYDTSPTSMSVISIPTQALISVPSLLAFSLTVTATTANTANFLVSARRRR